MRATSFDEIFSNIKVHIYLCTLLHFFITCAFYIHSLNWNRLQCPVTQLVCHGNIAYAIIYANKCNISYLILLLKVLLLYFSWGLFYLVLEWITMLFLKYHDLVYNTIMRKIHCYHLTARLFGISIVTDNEALFKS